MSRSSVPSHPSSLPRSVFRAFRTLALLSSFALSGACGGSASPTGVQHAPTSEGDFVVVSTAMLQCSDGRLARQRLERDFAAHQRTLDDEQADLRAQNARLGQMPEGPDRDRETEAYRASVAAIQQQFSAMQRELNDQEGRYTSAIALRIGAVHEHLGAAGWRVELCTEACETRRGQDRTADFVREYDARYASEPIALDP